ncbi:MAG TPA: flagellar hook-associated protein FlgL [Firmicutes bacterium]|nr:flagellar hook-associated protein FlgL [Bacillota bacterium]
MRITHRMIADTVNVNLQQSLHRLQQRSEQLSTGKSFHRPSQDPVGTNRVMRYRDSINRNECYRLNISEARGWLQATEAALMDGLDALQRIRELCIYGANGSLAEAELLSIAEEVHEFYRHLVGVGNTEYNGLYIFGGHQTGSPPYWEGAAGIEYIGDEGQRLLEISSHQEIVMNLDGLRAFGGIELMKAVSAVQEALTAGNQEALSGQALSGINEGIDLLLECLSEIGARQKRLEVMDDTLFEGDTQLKQRLSEVEDIDIALVITEYMMEEYAYRAALSTASRILQPSLVDYLS